MLPDQPTPENQRPGESVEGVLQALVTAAFPLSRWTDYRTIVAVSGGPDSVALLRLLLGLRPMAGSGELILAHFNYRLRGAESDADQAFVERLAAEHRLDCRVRRSESLMKSPAKGWEATLRDHRYQFFRELAAETGARYVALAHTADDQAETVLLRLLRGSSLAGLRGIPQQRKLTPETTLIRPLLQASRQDLRAYLAAIGQSFRLDSSNESDDFFRNRVRNHLLPLLASEYSPDIERRLLNLASEASETQAFLDEQVAPLLGRIGGLEEMQLRIPAGAFQDCAPLLARLALVQAWRQRGWSEQAMTAAHWRTLAELAAGTDALPRTLNLPGGKIARRGTGGDIIVE